MYTAIFICVATFVSYWVGWFMGRWRAKLEFEELRKQLEIDEDKEVDPFDELFRE